MTLDEYYRRRKNASLQEIYNSTLVNADFKTSNSSLNTKELEDFLTEIFYGEDKSQYRQIIEKAIDNRFYEEYQKMIHTDLSNLESKIFIENEDGVWIQLEQRVGREYNIVHTRGISISALEKELNQLNNLIRQLAKVPNEAKLGEVQNTAIVLKNRLDEILQEFQKGESKNTVSKVQYFSHMRKGLAEEIKNIEKEYQVLFSKCQGFSPTQSGTIFEWAVEAALALGASIGTDLGDEELQKFFSNAKTKWTGQDYIKGNLKVNITITSNTAPKKIIQKQQKKNIDTSGCKIVWTKDLESKRPGKMDVSFSSDTKNFKISAKNWAYIDAGDAFHNFGKIDLLNALRSLINKEENIDFMVFATGDQEIYRGIYIENIYKICAIIDILIGVVQKNNYVDTLVINNRREKRIQVYSMFELLQNIQRITLKNFDQFSRETLINMFNAVMGYKRSGEGRSEEISQLIRSYLSNIKVTLLATDVFYPKK